MVREYSGLRYVSFMGWVMPFRIPLMRGMTRIHGLSKVSGHLEGPELFWVVPEGSGCIWTPLKMPSCLRVLIC